MPLLLIAYNCEVFFPRVSEHACEFVRAAFIEYAIALLLVVALEIAMRPWLDRIREEYAEARDDLARYQKEAYERRPILDRSEWRLTAKMLFLKKTPAYLRACRKGRLIALGRGPT